MSEHSTPSVPVSLAPDTQEGRPRRAGPQEGPTGPDLTPVSTAVPRDLHDTLREIAARDGTNIELVLRQAAAAWTDSRVGNAEPPLPADRPSPPVGSRSISVRLRRDADRLDEGNQATQEVECATIGGAIAMAKELAIRWRFRHPICEVFAEDEKDMAAVFQCHVQGAQLICSETIRATAGVLKGLNDEATRLDWRCPKHYWGLHKDWRQKSKEDRRRACEALKRGGHESWIPYLDRGQELPPELALPAFALEQ